MVNVPRHPSNDSRLAISRLSVYLHTRAKKGPLRGNHRRTVPFAQYYRDTWISESPTPHDSDRLPDANRIIPPKPGGSPSDTLFLPVDSANDASSTLSLSRAFDSWTLLTGGPDFLSTFSLRPERKKERKLSNKPGFLPVRAGFSSAAAAAVSSVVDLREFLNLRFRSRLDLTLPMQETLGDEGSFSDDTDFPTVALRFGNNLVLWLRRFLASTKEGF